MFWLQKTISKRVSNEILKLYEEIKIDKIWPSHQELHDRLQRHSEFSELLDGIADFYRSNSFPLLRCSGIPNVKEKEFSEYLAMIFGNPIKFEGEGELVVAITPSGAADMKRPAFNNRLEFPLHTDMSYVDEPPTYFFLRVIDRKVNTGGTSLFTPVSSIVERMDSNLVDELRKEQFSFKPPPHFAGPPQSPKSIIKKKDGKWKARFREDAINVESSLAKKAVNSFLALGRELATEMIPLEGDLFIVDNEGLLHGREALAKGARRKIHRVYLTEV